MKKLFGILLVLFMVGTLCSACSTSPSGEEVVDDMDIMWDCPYDTNTTEKKGSTFVKKGLQLLNQHNSKSWGTSWCAPTGAGISLGYFAENGYPELVPDNNNNGKVDEEEKYEIIDELGKLMGTDKNKGTTSKGIIDGIEKFLKGKNAGSKFKVTRFDNPTYQQYRDELEKGEDVLVGVYTRNGGHILVGRSVSRVKNPDGTYNVDFVDPGTGKVYWTKMDPKTNKIFYNGEWADFPLMVAVSPVKQRDQPTTCMIVFDTTRSPFDNTAIRRGFSAAIDRETLVSSLSHPDAQPASTLVPSVLWQDEHSLYGEVGLIFDPGLADETRSSQDLPSSISLAAPQESAWIVEMIAENWRDYLGIDIEFASYPWEEYDQKLNEDQPDAFFVCWAMDYPSPYNFLHDGNLALIKWSNAEYDQLVELAAQEADENNQWQYYSDAEWLLCEDQAAIAPLYTFTKVNQAE